MNTLRSAATPAVPAWSQALTAWMFLAPALLFYVVFLVYPMLSSLWISLFKWDGLSAEMS